MRIGIDATPLPPDPVGAGTYIVQLVRSMAAVQSDHQYIVFAQPHGRQLIGELPSQRIEWVITPPKSPARRLVWEQTELPAQVKHYGVELLHSLHYTRPLALRCSSVVTFHDMTFLLFPELHTRAKRLFFPASIRLSARLADAIITDSESTRQDSMRLLGIPAERIFTVPLGISQAFHPIRDSAVLEDCRRRYNLPGSFILFVGLIEPRKNLPLLLRAYARLSQSGDYPPLVLAGRTGWMSEGVFQMVNELKLQDKVLFTGYLPAEELPIVYNLAQVFVYPSDYEGFGFPPLEAMACGTPVITTAVSAMQENVGDAGFLIPPRDEEALANALQTLLEQPALREHFSQIGRARALEFTWERTALQTNQVYQRVRGAS
jgi:glycosyltransferase involved in cell wall biosynthesis